MKGWSRYQSYLASGEWHIHTNYTDGKNSVDEYCRKAAELGMPLIAFTEHVRKKLTFNFDDLQRDIEKAREDYPKLIILSGCESKVLVDGSLDVSDDIIEQCDIVLMAIHSFPRDKDLYLKALTRALSNPDVDIWAHPGLFLIKTGFKLTDKEIREVLISLKDADVLLEINRRYGLPPVDWINLGRCLGIKFVIGSDVHDLSSLTKDPECWR
jgi:putative hydrolase